MICVLAFKDKLVGIYPAIKRMSVLAVRSKFYRAFSVER